MPSYDYRCNDCDLKLVVIRSLQEKERNLICPNDGSNLVRQYTSPAVTFKGTGWGKD